MSRLLGLDIGGTSSQARASVDSDVVAEAEASSASLTAAGLDGAAAALDDLLARLPIGAGQPFDAACASSAGSNVPGASEFLRARLAPLTRSGTVVIVNDAMLALPRRGAGRRNRRDLRHRLRELYPRFGDFVRARDEADPAGRFTNPYLNRVLGPPPGTGSPTDGPG